MSTCKHVNKTNIALMMSKYNYANKAMILSYSYFVCLILTGPNSRVTYGPN